MTAQPPAPASSEEPVNQSVGEDFPNQQKRVRELRQAYVDIGPAGRIGLMFIDQALERADRAAISGDVLEILRSYEELKGFKE